jgi:hypothetical protein
VEASRRLSVGHDPPIRLSGSRQGGGASLTIADDDAHQPPALGTTRQEGEWTPLSSTSIAVRFKSPMLILPLSGSRFRDVRGQSIESVVSR